MEALLAFAAALVALRLAGRVAGRWRARRAPELLAWSAALFAYAVAAAALAWGAAHGWDARAFRVYYLFGGLLTAPLLGAGSLLIWRRRWAGPVALVYAGLAVGIAIAVPVHGVFSGERHPGGAGSPRLRAGAPRRGRAPTRSARLRSSSSRPRRSGAGRSATR